MKRKILATVITMCMAFAACFALVACTPSEQEAQTYVSLDTHPSIELTLDKNDKVVSVRGANEDGQVLLYGEADLTGLSVDAAVEKITELAVEYGYLDEDNKVVQTNVVGSKRVDGILSKVNAQVTATAEKLNVSVNCTGADAFSLARKLDNLKAKYPDNEAIQSLTPSKLKLVVSASETGEISVEAAAELDTSELVAIVSKAHAEMEQYATAAYSKAKSEAEDAFAKAQTEAIDGIYVAYFVNPVFVAKNPLGAYYAMSYMGYRASAVTTNALADVMFYAEQACDTPLDEAQIAEVSKALGLGDNVDCLKNSQKEITGRSIEAYADKTFKNSQAGADLEQVKQALTEALNKTENAIQAEIDKFNAKYQTELEQVKSVLTEASELVQSAIGGLLSDEVKQQIEASAKDANDIVKEIDKIISDGKITSDEVRSVSKLLQSKADATRATMDGKLTDEDRDKIAEQQANAEKTLASVKTQMDEAIAKAEAEAQAYLQQLKDARANASK